MIGRTIFVTITLILQVSLAAVNIIPKSEETINTSSNEMQTDDDYCCFCDDHELTTKEKCEELLIKCLTDETNWLNDGIITQEVYELQIEPFNKAMDYLEIATDEEIEEMYKELLLANLDWLEEDKAEGEEIDESFYNYIVNELEKMK